MKLKKNLFTFLLQCYSRIFSLNSVSGDMITAYKRGDKNLNLRHEWKHLINYGDMIVLRKRLSAVMKTDENAIDGRYFIRSLYFDNLEDKALLEKLN